MTEMVQKNDRLKYVVQLLATIAILAFVPGNVVKLVSLLVLWVVTFYPLTRHELILFLSASVLFSVMDIMATQQGIFFFTKPDAFGLPYWEFCMFGFYTLHGLRILKGPVPVTDKIQAGILVSIIAFVICSVSGLNVLMFGVMLILFYLILFFHVRSDIFALGFLSLLGNGLKYLGVFLVALAFSVSFSCIANQEVLTIVTFTLLFIAIYIFHEKYDFIYLGYFVLMGMGIEYAGVYFNVWGYPGHPIIGIPFWFITMWGCIGLLLRRLILPMMDNSSSNQMRIKV